jgi:hypothetical protein
MILLELSPEKAAEEIVELKASQATSEPTKIQTDRNAVRNIAVVVWTSGCILALRIIGFFHSVRKLWGL